MISLYFPNSSPVPHTLQHTSSLASLKYSEDHQMQGLWHSGGQWQCYLLEANLKWLLVSPEPTNKGKRRKMAFSEILDMRDSVEVRGFTWHEN